MSHVLDDDDDGDDNDDNFIYLANNNNNLYSLYSGTAVEVKKDKTI